ncbi:hypothetical protein PENSPDRAFT_595694 [Peniophora sp. CONT]|nr:hypothetical protein PENSPDRAFT_595694 [Peniophora sp. CONT]
MLDLLALLHSDTRLHNICHAFWTLCDRVRTSIQTQMRDRECLQEQKQEVLRFLRDLEQNRGSISVAEYKAATGGVTDMLSCLDEAAMRSAAPADPTPLVVCETVRTGQRGRPPIRINREFLGQALTMRGPVRLSRTLPCSARTIRRRAQEEGFLQRGAPVFTYTPNNNGTITRTYRSTTAHVSTLSDEQLDALVVSILHHFPNFGRRMIAGSLSARGHNVPRAHIIALYVLFHAFVDGHLCLVTGIRANNNNRGETVLRLFHDACTFISE